MSKKYHGLWKFISRKHLIIPDASTSFYLRFFEWHFCETYSFLQMLSQVVFEFKTKRHSADGSLRRSMEAVLGRRCRISEEEARELANE